MADVKGMVDALVSARRTGTKLAADAVAGGMALIAGLGQRALGAKAAPAPASDDDAELFLRAMVAATLADGMIDADERRRLDEAMAKAGLDEAATRWLERELSAPASIDELADPVDTPEKAAQVYAAARLAIDPDTMQERAFLRMLAEALDVPADAVARVEAEAA
jgi:uncharacterized membrane protein YebE (DUF533 family)